MHLRRASALLVLPLLVALAPASPPAVASARVGMVSFAAASSTTLTLTWPRASGVSGYQVYKSLHKNMAYAKTPKNVSGPTATVGGLTPGETYCFQVRGNASSSVGRSSVTCHPTIRAQSATTGTAYKVMTFNACTDACSGWASRSSAAKELISVREPDLLAVQEANSWESPPTGYALAIHKSAKRIFYKTSRFSVARSGEILMRAPNKYAVWSELVDRGTGKRMIFVSAHTSPAFADYPERGQEIQTLMSRVNQLNTAGHAVMYAGDFNSHKNRGTYSESAGFGAQDSVGRTFASAGYYDSYDLARKLSRNNWNSYGGWSTTPTKSVAWGDHVDHVYVKPSRSNVYHWQNAALNSGGRYSAPMASDHRAVMAQLYVN